jgi:CDP-glucose 4,6-dehydratase
MTILFDNFYNGKTVFITGHTGFQGSWLSLWLKLLGANVVGYSLPPPTTPSLFESLNIKKKITSQISDINDKDKLFSIMSKHNPDVVIHLAAQSLVRKSYENPLDTFSTNVIGTANLLESMRNVSSVKSCVIMTSDKAYENKEWDYAYRENDSMGGHDPYSASKGAAELIVSSFRRSFFNQKTSPGIASIRAGNVIGGGDWSKDRLVPDCIRALQLNKKITLRNPKSVRPWQFVLESLSGLLLVGSKLTKNPTKFGKAWNVGPINSDISVKDVVKKIIKKWGYGTINFKKNTLHEAKSLRLDSSNITNMLKWTPTYSFDESIDETINWYLHFNNKKLIYDYTVSQIENYVSKANTSKNVWAFN